MNAPRPSSRLSWWPARVADNSSTAPARPLPRVLPALVALWAITLAAAVVWIWNFKTTPGRPSQPPATWPASVRLPQRGRTLIVTLHPLCACSQATISELGRLMAKLEPPPTVYALFYSSTSEPTRRLEDTTLWQRTAAIPHVTPLVDANGTMATAFGAETSGDVIAFGARGQLLFHGGLTPARGHEGDSFGQRRLLAVLRGETPDRSDSPVFGCALRHESAQADSPSTPIPGAMR
jgi:hypothetical protein